MSDVLRVARLYWALLALFTIGRWAMGSVPYEKGHHVLSIVTLTFMASAFFAAFCRAWRRYPWGRAALLGLVFGLSAQIVIFLSTVASYLLGLETYFNHPQALNAPAALSLGEAIRVRAGGLVAAPIANAVAASIGWLLGALLPRAQPSEAP